MVLTLHECKRLQPVNLLGKLTAAKRFAVKQSTEKANTMDEQWSTESSHSK